MSSIRHPRAVSCLVQKSIKRYTSSSCRPQTPAGKGVRGAKVPKQRNLAIILLSCLREVTGRLFRTQSKTLYWFLEQDPYPAIVQLYGFVSVVKHS